MIYPWRGHFTKWEECQSIGYTYSCSNLEFFVSGCWLPIDWERAGGKQREVIRARIEQCFVEYPGDTKMSFRKETDEEYVQWAKEIENGRPQM